MVRATEKWGKGVATLYRQFSEGLFKEVTSEQWFEPTHSWMMEERQNCKDLSRRKYQGSQP